MSSGWSHPAEDNNVYNRAKEEAWAQYQREYDAATAVSGSVAAAAASGAVQRLLRTFGASLVSKR
jgi:hypothetical protein